MDIERGCLEILFKEIPYEKITLVCLDPESCHDYSKVNKNLYLQHSSKIFPCYSEDERLNHYEMLNQHLRDNETGKPNIFWFIMNIAVKMLTFNGGEIRCKFDEMLRWREISFQLGQDFFTCAFLASLELSGGYSVKNFSWLPIIRSDDERLHNILRRGMAENHFHLGGSTKIFELNWVCLMNIIENRIHDFRKIKRAAQDRSFDLINDYNSRDPFYVECQWAAFYRIYLFLALKKDEKLLEPIIDHLKKGARIEEELSSIQDIIDHTREKYGAVTKNRAITEDGEVTEDGYRLDYAYEKDMVLLDNDACRLLSGERRFLYECYKAAACDEFNNIQKNMFYRYLSIRTDFRGELIQINRQVGFANFKNYQDRKEFFIEGEKKYEQELVRLALNASMQKQNILSLEARICPKNTSVDLHKALKYYNNIFSQKAEGNKEQLFYVLHFPKSEMEAFCEGAPRNYKVRSRTKKQAKAIVALLEKGLSDNQSIRGIDACSNEIGCRPEVFAPYFRYLQNISFPLFNIGDVLPVGKDNYIKLHVTYHAGEDFLDLVDGLRAVDETILFCDLKRGSRIGHGLALGISPEEYYQYKNYKIVISKQDLLDDIVWLLSKAKEVGCEIDQQLYYELKDKFYSLFKEIYGAVLGDSISVSVEEYYQSWKLRGDEPENYRYFAEEFMDKMSEIRFGKIDRYDFNYRVSDNIRKVEKYRKIYYLYHYNKHVRDIGNQMSELKVSRIYAAVVRKIQDSMIHSMCLEGIAIETNPSSNYLIGTLTKYDKHPILRFNSRKLGETKRNMSLNVSINTDDQGVFDTMLENEYALMTLALKKAKDCEENALYDIEDIYEWIDYVRKMGLEQVFRNYNNCSYSSECGECFIM